MPIIEVKMPEGRSIAHKAPLVKALADAVSGSSGSTRELAGKFSREMYAVHYALVGQNFAAPAAATAEDLT